MIIAHHVGVGNAVLEYMQGSCRISSRRGKGFVLLAKYEPFPRLGDPSRFYRIKTFISFKKAAIFD